MDLRKLAKGKPCMVRIPYVCNGDAETTVLAHIRRANIAGIGQKASDLCGVWACSDCHDVIDGRRQIDWRDEKHINGWVLDGLCRTLQHVAQEIEL